MSTTVPVVNVPRKCLPGQHKDVLMRGSKRIKCTVCEDAFPCSYKCEHVDCCSVRGDSLPDWVTTSAVLTLEECLNT